jgi:hypothetical protein
MLIRGPGALSAFKPCAIPAALYSALKRLKMQWTTPALSGAISSLKPAFSSGFISAA